MTSIQKLLTSSSKGGDGSGSLIRSNGDKVSLEELAGKILGIYFSSPSMESCAEFTPKLKAIYNELKKKEEPFEVVSLIFHEENEESFRQNIESIPWLIVPFGDYRSDNAADDFNLDTFPMLAIIGKDGNTISRDVCDLVNEFGVHVYPFSPEKFAELEALEKERQKAQTLESLLVAGQDDFVIGKDGNKVLVSELVGKTLLFYFSGLGCPPCQELKPKLIKAYHEIKEKGCAFEVILISRDTDQSFDELYLEMPWLTLPSGDQRIKPLWKRLKVRHMPTLVAISPTGQTITKNAVGLVTEFGSDAFPFTDEHLEELVQGVPKRLKHVLHGEHELELLLRPDYSCDGCSEIVGAWSFCCTACSFDLHIKCGLAEGTVTKGDGGSRKDNDDSDNGSQPEGPNRDGYICTGGVCYRI